jgi:hypothetical protein
MNPAITSILTVIVLGVVAVILLMGLWNMARGGDANLSQRLMRARVIAQAVAIAVILGALFLFGHP